MALHSQHQRNHSHYSNENNNPFQDIPNPVQLLSKAASFVTKPIVKIGETVLSDLFQNQDSLEPSGYYSTNAPQDEEDRMSLEGTLYFRRGRAQGSTSWKKRLIMLDFEDAGTLACYKGIKEKDATKVLHNMYSKLHRHLSVGKNILDVPDRNLRLFLPAEVPWVAKDVENDSSMFVVEVPTDNPKWLKSLLYFESNGVHETNLLNPSHDPHPEDDDEDEDEDDLSSFVNTADDFSSMSVRSRSSIEAGFKKARARQKPLRFYFKCPRKGNEKALWMRAFAKVGRLSSETRKRRRLLGNLGHINIANSRIRNYAGAQFARETRHLDIAMSTKIRNSSVLYLHKDIEELAKRKSLKDEREFRVSPTYCYPHMWMTQTELREECNLPSKEFHDLRLPSQKGQEIGTMRVEVLQCMGLPKLDRNGHSDAVVYLVCGSYAFATDVIPDNANPMWLRKSRRACLFPVFHGYARLYVGVFDDDGAAHKDDLAGRVVIDIARLRPGCRYDVTLPLRLSAHVYSRRQRGAVRLRFQLDWHSEKAALMSYIPKKIKFRNIKPNYDTTVMCADSTCFRNVVLTVHGVHPPGKFSFNQFRATIKEVNFARKMVMTAIKDNILDTIRWKNPALSLYVFLAWMHCIYQNSFGLVPAYTVTFFMLLMMRNYARYGIDTPNQRGFLPPTWEELFMVLLSPKRKSSSSSYRIEQLTLRSGKSSQSRASFTDESLHELDGPLRAFTVETHKPLGKTLFRALGFLESEEEVQKMSPDERHLEFPFAPGEYYPKFSLKEAVVTAKKAKEEDKKTGLSIESEDTAPDSKIEGKDPSVDDIDFEFTSGLELQQKDGLASTNHEDSTRDGETSDSEHLAVHLGTTVHIPSTRPSNIVTMQDIDATYEGQPTKLTDDLAEVKEKMHELTCHLFNDRTHLKPHSEALSYGNPRKSSSRKKDAGKELEKLINVGNYSHSNPVISRVGLYLTPVVNGALSFLCVFRALFNVFTWRDPFLSFWVSLVGTGAALVLFIFPWRLFLFVAGIVVVGPQNWILRLVKERREQQQQQEEEEEDDDDEPNKDQSMRDMDLIRYQPKEMPEDQPLFQAHPMPNQRLQTTERDKVDDRQVHHVIVPYSPLMYQRFYDFPPEPEYSHVKDATKKAVNKRRSLLVNKETFEITDATDLLFDEQVQDSTQSFPDVSMFQPQQIARNGRKRIPPTLNEGRDQLD